MTDNASPRPINGSDTTATRSVFGHTVPLSADDLYGTCHHVIERLCVAQTGLEDREMSADLGHAIRFVARAGRRLRPDSTTCDVLEPEPFATVDVRPTVIARTVDRGIDLVEWVEIDGHPVVIAALKVEGGPTDATMVTITVPVKSIEFRRSDQP